MSARPFSLSRPTPGRPSSTAGVRGASSNLRSEAPEARISVGRLRLKMQAADGATARRIVQRASELAAARLPSGLAGHVAGLSLKVRPRNLSEAAITEALADAMVTALRRRGGDRA